MGDGRAGPAADMAGGVAVGGSTAGGGRRDSGGGVRGEGSGGAPAAPPLRFPPVRARREDVRLSTMLLRYETAQEHGALFTLWHARSVESIEDCRPPGIDGDAGERSQPEEAREGPPTQ